MLTNFYFKTEIMILEDQNCDKFDQKNKNLHKI